MQKNTSQTDPMISIVYLDSESNNTQTRITCRFSYSSPRVMTGPPGYSCASPGGCRSASRFPPRFPRLLGPAPRPCGTPLPCHYYEMHTICHNNNHDKTAQLVCASSPCCTICSGIVTAQLLASACHHPQHIWNLTQGISNGIQQPICASETLRTQNTHPLITEVPKGLHHLRYLAKSSV